MKQIYKIMRKYKTSRAYSTVFLVQNDRLIWSDGYMLIIAKFTGLPNGIYTIDNIPANNINFPSWEKIVQLTGTRQEKVEPLKFGKSIKAIRAGNPAYMSLSGQLILTSEENALDLKYANIAHELGCTKCYFWESPGMYVFSTENDEVMLYVGAMAP